MSPQYTEFDRMGSSASSRHGARITNFLLHTQEGDGQGGALYRHEGRTTYWVHGASRDRWNRSGYENGPLGWPVSDEIPWDTGAYQNFDNGRIYWTPAQTLAAVTADGVDQPLHDQPD